MPETQNGVPVNFSFASAAGVTLVGSADDGTFGTANPIFTGAVLLQSGSEKKQSNRTLVKDGTGDRSTSIHNDRVNACSLRYVVTGSSLANAIVNSSLSQPGNFIKITACATMPDLAHISNLWEIISCDLNGGNDSVKEISYELEYSDSIQARAT